MIRIRSVVYQYIVKDAPARIPKPVIIPANNLSKLTNMDFSVFIQETATIESIRAIGLQGLLSSLESRKELMTHKDIFRIVTGLCRLDVIHNNGILQLLLECFDARMRSLMAHEIALMAVELSACTRRLGETSYTHAKKSVIMVLEFLVDQFKKKIDAASPRDLAYMLSAVADMGLTDAELIEVVGNSASMQIGLFHGPDLADLWIALDVLGAHHQRFFASSVPHLTNRISLFHDKQIIPLVGVVSRAFLRDIADVSQITRSRLIERLVTELETRPLHDITQGWQNFEGSLKNLGIEEKVPRAIRFYRKISASLI